MDRVTDFESVGCAFESRRGHFYLLPIRLLPSNPRRGDCVSRLRVSSCGGQASRAGGISIGCLSDYCLRTPRRGQCQLLARLSRAGGISIGCLSGYCLRTAVEGTGQQLVRSISAGGISVGCLSDYCLQTAAGGLRQSVARFLLRRTGESRRGHFCTNCCLRTPVEGTMSVGCAFPPAEDRRVAPGAFPFFCL